MATSFPKFTQSRIIKKYGLLVTDTTMNLPVSNANSWKNLATPQSA